MEGLHDDLLDINLSPPEIKLVLATKSQRLANYLGTFVIDEKQSTL